MEDFDENTGDFEDVSSMDMSSESVGDDLSDMPEAPDDTSTDVSDVPEDPEMSISELYEQGQQDMLQAQQEAEEWANENDITKWSNGDAVASSDMEEMPDIPEEMPQEVSDVSEDNEEFNEPIVNEVVDSVEDTSEEIPEPSISELYEQSQQDMFRAQQEAEDWADAHGVNAWSDGSMRKGHEDDEYVRTSLEADQMEKEGLEQQAEYYKNQGKW